MKRFLKIIIIIIFLFIILAITNILSGNQIVNRVYDQIISRFSTDNQISNMISYKVYDNTDNNNIKILVIFNNDIGIRRIVEPNGKILECNGKKEVAIDYITTLEKEEIFQIKLLNNQEGECKIKTTPDEIYQKVQEKVKSDLKVGDLLEFDNIEFKIANLDNGLLELGGNEPVGSVTLSGGDGYNNCESVLNTECENLFINDQRVLSARSADMNDYIAGSIAQTVETTCWLATKEQRFAYQSYGLFIKTVSSVGASEATMIYSRYPFGDTSYSHTLSLLPIITIDESNLDDISVVQDNKYFIKV